MGLFSQILEASLTILDTDSDVTKRVKNDYNRMDDQEFINKYSASKST